jgi:cytochrome P450
LFVFGTLIKWFSVALGKLWVEFSEKFPLSKCIFPHLRFSIEKKKKKMHSYLAERDDAFGMLALVAGCVLIIRWLFSGGNASSQSAPPLVRGYPFFGVWFQLSANPRRYLAQCRKDLGDVFTLYVCGRNYHIVMDHKLSDVFYARPDAEVSAEGGPFVAVLGSLDSNLFRGQSPSVVYRDVAQWLTIFHKHVATGLNGKYLKSYGAYIGEGCRRSLSERVQLGSGGGSSKGVVDVFELIEDISIATSLRIFLGADFAVRHAGVRDDFMMIKHFFENYAAHPLLKHVVLFLPTAQNYRVRAAIARVKAAMIEQVERMYESSESETILFTALKQSKVADIPGGPPRGVTIICFLLLITATANAPLTCFWVLYELLRNPGCLRRARAEQDEVRAAIVADGLDPDTDPAAFTNRYFMKMSYMDYCIFEAIRLYQGPLHAGNVLRGIHVPQQVGKFVLPAGDLLAVGTDRYRDAALFERPDEFVPERWADTEFRATVYRDFYRFSPFGSHVHACPGKNIARLFVKSVVGELVRRYDIELAGPFEPLHPPFTGIRPARRNPGDNLIQLKLRA